MVCMESIIDDPAYLRTWMDGFSEQQCADG